MQFQPEKINPYLVLTPVRIAGMFFGPFATAGKIYSVIAIHESVSLVGPRHSGKTSLLYCLTLPAIQAHFPEYDVGHCLFVYIDVRNCLRKTGDDFLEFVSEKIIAAARERFALSSSKTGEDRFMDILQQVKDQHYHTVMLFDVFEEITRNKAFDPEFFMFLRAQASAGLVSYVTASIRPLEEISHQDIQGSPFFNIFAKVPINLLMPEEAQNLVMLPSEKGGCPFSEEECAWVLELAGHHPFFIMNICNALFTFRQRVQRPTCEQERKSLEEDIYNVLSPHFEYLWEELSDEIQMAVIAKTQQLDVDSSDESLPGLIESSLFCKFVCAKHAFLDTIEDELRSVLKHLDSSHFLASSKLTYLKVVTMRIRQKGATSKLEKGQIIRGVLNEALEQLRGEGPRLDTALSWKNYNILHYNYFSNNNALNQAGIAQHLAVSLRQYHREKDEAIQALLDSLLKMEATFK